MVDVCVSRIEGVTTEAQAGTETDVRAHDGKQQKSLGPKTPNNYVGTSITLFTMSVNSLVGRRGLATHVSVSVGHEHNANDIEYEAHYEQCP
jgi:hypothetical protein